MRSSRLPGASPLLAMRSRGGPLPERWRESTTRCFGGSWPEWRSRYSLSGFGGAVFHIHKVVRDHVQHDHVTVFDAAHVRIGYLDVELRERTQFPAVPAGQCDGVAADRISIFDGSP